MISTGINSNAILDIYGVDCLSWWRCTIFGIRKTEVKTLLKISDLIEKNGSIEKNSFFLLIKNELKNTYYQQNKEKLKEYARNCYHSSNGKVIAKEYYINHREKLQEQARNWYRNFSEEGNNNRKKRI